MMIIILSLRFSPCHANCAVTSQRDEHSYRSSGLDWILDLLGHLSHFSSFIGKHLIFKVLSPPSLTEDYLILDTGYPGYHLLVLYVGSLWQCFYYFPSLIIYRNNIQCCGQDVRCERCGCWLVFNTQCLCCVHMVCTGRCSGLNWVCLESPGGG